MIDTIARPWAFLLLALLPFVFYRAAGSFIDRTRSVKLWIALLRCAIGLLVIIELAGVTVWWKGKAGDEYICYVADVSDSVNSDMRLQAREQVIAGVESKGNEEQASLVLFGESPEAAIPFGTGMTREKITAAFEPYLNENGNESRIGGQRTDLSRALSIALAGFPAKAQKRIVLLTDGNQTDGDVLQLANAASDQYVQICPVPLSLPDFRDVVVASITVPERIKREEAFEIKSEIRSTGDAQGRLKLYVDDYLAEERQVKLSRGVATEVFRRSLEEGGDHLLRVQFAANFEQPTENDTAYAYITLPGRPRILVVSDTKASPIIDALTASRFRVDRRSPVGAPRTMLGLARYDAVILENVPAASFGENRLRLLRDYVSEFGGGLVLSGGRNSFGAGGYAGTPIEEASPVHMEISAEERPSTSIMVAVDDSRSMWLHGTSDLEYKIERFGIPPKHFDGLVTHNKAGFVKEVFKRIVLSLSPRDRVGAVGMSSDLLPARWYLRPQRVTDKQRLIKEFSSKFSRRSYSVLYPTLDEGRFYLANDPATYKQILLLTDGFVQSDENYMKFAMMVLSDGVSLSTVGVGADSNNALLDSMARWGGGRFYSAKDVKNIGEVYQKELEAPATALLIERPVSVAPVSQSDLVAGLDMNLAPTLFGYVRSRPKAAADVVLAVEGTSDPLLVSWKFGEGKVIAFTSAAVGSWATLWVKDWEEGYSRFWHQLVKGTLKAPGKEIYRPYLKPDGLRFATTTDVLDENDNFVNESAVSAQLFYLGEKGDIFSPAVSWNAPLLQKSPGRYESSFDVERSGVYMVSVSGSGERAGTVETTGSIIATPAEHLSPMPDEPLLAAIASVTKGQVSATALAAASVEGLEERRRYDLGFYSMILAALLLVTEIVVRRWPAFAEAFGKIQAEDSEERQVGSARASP